MTATWVRAAALARPAALSPLLDALGASEGTSRRDVQASLFLEAYMWELLLPVTAAIVAGERVPDVDARVVRLRFGPDGRVCAVASGATAPGGAVLGALRDRLVERHAARLVDALAGLSGRPRRALWRGAADSAAAAFLQVAQDRGRPEDGMRLARELLAGPPPLRAVPRFLEVRDAGRRPRHVRLRTGCCLWWRTAAATTCATCPLTPDGERRRRLRASETS